MALIQCPECGQNISDQSNTCIHCGYPISKHLEQNKNPKSYDIKFKCYTKQNRIYSACLSMETILKIPMKEALELTSNPDSVLLKGIAPQTAECIVNYFKQFSCELEMIPSTEDNYNKLNNDLKQWVISHSDQIINNHSDQINNIPKCPTCNSTNIEKISTGKKMVGGFMFGIFSSNVRNTMYCKNCGYKW